MSTAISLQSPAAAAESPSIIIPYIHGVWLDNANRTRTFICPAWESTNDVRGRFDNKPFRCHCQNLPGSHVHWDKCQYNNERLKRLEIEGPYDPRFAMDEHFSNKDGTITRIQVSTQNECSCRGVHAEDCTYGLVLTFPCHCKFLDPKNPIHWDHCAKVRHEREVKEPGILARAASVQSTRPERGSSSEYSWSPSLKDLSDTDSND